MNQTTKQIVAGVVSLVILGVGYYGNYLPYQKSQAYIASSRSIGSIRTFNEFKDIISLALDLPSPIGQEELVRNTGGTILGLIQVNGQNAQLTAAAIDYLMQYYKPVIDRGRGMSFEQNLYLLGLVYENASLKTKNVDYLRTAQAYYEEGLQHATKRPQFLYGLFDIYRMEGDVNKTTAVFNQISAQWPDDINIRNQYNTFFNRVVTSTTRTISL